MFWHPEYSNTEHLGRLQFMQMLTLAFVVHIMAFVVWYLLPSMGVDVIPVRVLNIKIGRDMGEQPTGAIDSTSAAMQEILNPESVVRPMEMEPYKKPDPVKPQPETKPVQPQTVVPRTQVPTTTPNVTSALTTSQRPKQYTRQMPSKSQAGGEGVPLGNSNDPNAEMVHRYTQLLALAVDHQKSKFPIRIPKGMQFRGSMYFKIDRKGYVLFSTISKSTGNAELDEVMKSMVAGASPMPAAPENYKGGKLLAFEIPIEF